MTLSERGPAAAVPPPATPAETIPAPPQLPATVPIQLRLNGHPRAIAVAPHHTLLDVLRDDLGLTGTKECCLVGECGACTVRLNDRIVDSCLVLAVEADGGEVLTVEGLANGQTLAPIQRAFLEHGAVQCGFCIPGQLMAADDILRRHADPSVEEIQEGLAGNLCRCACYVQIVEAVEAAARDPDQARSRVTDARAGDVPLPPLDQ